MAFVGGALANNAPAVWVPDTASEKCGSCDLGFSITRRRHHCRVCGGLFCNGCSQQRVTGTGSSAALRVCDACAQRVQAAEGNADHARDQMMWEQERNQLTRGLAELQQEYLGLQQRFAAQDSADPAETAALRNRLRELELENEVLQRDGAAARAEQQAADARRAAEAEEHKARLAAEVQQSAAQDRAQMESLKEQHSEQAAAREREWEAQLGRMKAQFEAMLQQKQSEIEQLKASILSLIHISEPTRPY
eukprot:TRINITY_DN22270_c0_g1_i1.p1 TRINITY_DN22270_c0_g1~~TRINITY_DN22270_c0_g1_i1.p1  ORF type:complete len:250 (+),score=57.86 TRINITY_DN22270_c0_g1_i1:153-902(+)